MEIIKNGQVVNVPNEAVNEAAKRGAYAGVVIKRKEQSKKCDDAILEYVKKNGIVKTSVMSQELDFPDSTIRQHVRNLGKTHPNIKTSYGKVEWVETEEKKPAEKAETQDRYKFPKNNEGYTDFTAAKASNAIDDIHGAFTPGDIWICDVTKGVTGKYVVLASYKGCVTCVPVKNCGYAEYNPVCCVVIDFQSKAFVDLRFIVTKASRYFVEKSGEVKNPNAIKTKLTFLLGIEPVERVVEKVVTKEVVKEVPIEKEVIKEVPVERSIDTVESALTKQEGEIYKSITWALIAAIGGNFKEEED